MSSFPPAITTPYPSAHPSARQYEMGPWMTYTATWTTDGSAPTIGNGVCRGGYRRHGTTLHLRGQLAVGSTSTVGTGEIRVSIPSGMTSISTHNQILAATWYDSSAATLYRGVAITQAGAGYLTFQFVDTGPRGISSGLGSGDEIDWTGTFEITA